MSLKVTGWGRTAQDQQLGMWRAILENQEYHSYFQTPEWVDLLCQTIPQAINYTTWFRFSDGSEAVFPCIATPKLLGFKRLESLPWGTYGSILTNAPHPNEQFQAVIRHMLSWRCPMAKITTPPIAPVGEIENAKVQKRATHILPLNQSFEEIWQQFQSRSRTAIRKAEREGVTVWKSDRNTQKHALIVLQELYKKACEYWHGVDTLPDAFFDRLRSIDPSKASIFIAEKEEAPLAADLLFYGKGEVQYFAGASLRQYSEYQAPKLLMCEMIRDACERNFAYFNLGASGGLKGVEQFKRLFAAKEYTYNQYLIVHPLLKCCFYETFT